MQINYFIYIFIDQLWINLQLLNLIPQKVPSNYILGDSVNFPSIAKTI